MVVYEVYIRSNEERNELIGVFPERRSTRDRMNSRSVMKWSELVFGDSVDPRSLFFIQKTV
jgi:hypothetical protein